MGADDLRLVANHFRDTNNRTAQAIRLNSREKACPRNPRTKAIELTAMKTAYVKIGVPGSSGFLYFSNVSSKVSNISLTLNARSL